jgi:glycosyltransferase involved in cell wall biosynthesis
MNVLYYIEPKMYPYGGVDNVAENLSRVISHKTQLVVYPRFEKTKKYCSTLIKIQSSLLFRNFDIIHCNVTPSLTNGSYTLFESAKLSGASTILNIHGIIQLEYIMYPLRDKWFWFTSYRGLASTLRYCKLADRIVTYSNEMKNRIMTWYNVNPEKVVVIRHGVDIAKFRGFRSQLLLDGDPSILVIGNLAKNIDFLIKALSTIKKEIPQFKLHVVGPGDIAPLKALAQKEGLENQVIFYGAIPPEETPHYYKAVDFCVFPSILAPAGITLLEAMASGTPILASNKGGIPEIVYDNLNGVLFDPDNVNALPDAILNLSKDDKLRAKIANNALKAVEDYSWEKVGYRYLSLYKSLRIKSSK